MEHWKTAQYIFEDGHMEIFENYMVSDFGQVKSLDYNRTGKEKVLKQREHNDVNAMSYEICLHKNNKTYTLFVHRLVLSTFKEKEYFPNAVVDHIIARDDSSCDNRLCNLRWTTQQQNISSARCKSLLSKTHINHPSLSKRVRVTDLTTRETTEYLSANEACRDIELPQGTVAIYIKQRKGFYKKLNLLFEYID